MTEEQRAQAIAMLGGGAAQQAAQAINPANRNAQLAMQKQAAMGAPGPMIPQASQTTQIDPSILQRLIMMLRGGRQ